MEKIKEILVVLNSFENLSTILEKSFNLAKKIDARVSILYVYEKPLFSIEEIFKLNDSTIDKEKIKEHIKQEVSKYSDDEVAILVKINDTADQAWDIVKDDTSFLIITPYHKEISKELLKTLKQNIFFIKSDTLEYKKGSLITETLLGLEDSIKLYKELFNVDIEVIYNFYYIPDAAAIDPALTIGLDPNLELLETQEKLFNDFLKEHNLKGEFFVNSFLGELTLVEYVNSNSFDLVWYRKDDGEFLIADDTLEEIGSEIKCDLFVERIFAI